MNEFEYFDFSSMTDPRISLRSEDTSLCWHCKEDVNRRKLISACNCTNVFIHVHCLKEIGNTEHILYCSRCKARYPLEIRRKSLLKMLRKVCVPFFMIQCLIFSYLMLGGLAIYWLLLVDVQDIHLLSIIMKIISISVYFYLVYITAHKIIDWSRTIYQLYDQWYNSTKLKYIKRYNVHIQNTEE